MSGTIKDLGETLAQLIDKLAGKGSDLEISFKDLRLEIAGLKVTLNGSVTLDILYVTEKK